MTNFKSSNAQFSKSEIYFNHFFPKTQIILFETQANLVFTLAIKFNVPFEKHKHDLISLLQNRTEVLLNKSKYSSIHKTHFSKHNKNAITILHNTVSELLEEHYFLKKWQVNQATLKVFTVNFSINSSTHLHQGKLSLNI